MLHEVQPTLLSSGPYATVDDLLEQSDLLEQDVTIRRWHKNGRPLRLRVKALNLEQQDAIHLAALIKHKKTGLWEADRLVFCAHSLVAGVRMPALDLGQAQALVRKNPSVINSLVDFIWALAALDLDTIEQAAHAMAPAVEDPTAGDDTRSDAA